MSAERRWDQRRFQLEESTTLNGGARTIFIEHMTPGTTVPPHFHNRFSETFDLISGSMSVYNCSTSDLDALEASAQQLEIGKSVTVKPGVYHKYLVGSEQTVLRCIVTPGDAGFERLLMIMNGMHEDEELRKMGDSLVLMAVFIELSDAHLIGPAKEMLDEVREGKEDEINAMREKLLEKYDTEDSLRRLLGKSE